MRILAVSHTATWPVRSGSANRRLMTLHALAQLGKVDLLYAGEVLGYASRTPADAPVENVWDWPVARVRPKITARARWLMHPHVPYQMIEWDDPRQPPPWRDRYDVIWYFRPVAYELARQVEGVGRVVDLDDLEDDKLRQARAAGIRRGPSLRRLADWRNTLAWERYQRRLARAVDAVTVCKDEDREKLGADNCYVVPNGFPPVSPAGEADRSCPTLLFIGLFEYGPNADGARYLVKEVFPAVRSVMPDVRLRLVGRGSSQVRELAGEGVHVVGEVPDLAPEYDLATVVTAPIRFGGGTRVKILEAFARRVPVVSTTVGAAGLGAVHGEHLLLADEAAAFADACVTLLNDSGLRRRLVTSAVSLYESRFSQSAVTIAVKAVLEAARSNGLE